jgi:hypothetical protein
MDSEVVADKGGKFSIVSPFNDYAHRGEALNTYCLFDYFADFVKDKKKTEIAFDPEHSQHHHHSQFLRKLFRAVPNLLGKIMFVHPNSTKEVDCSDLTLVLVLPLDFFSPGP